MMSATFKNLLLLITAVLALMGGLDCTSDASGGTGHHHSHLWRRRTD
jgi:hypothetical protein